MLGIKTVYLRAWEKGDGVSGQGKLQHLLKMLTDVVQPLPADAVAAGPSRRKLQKPAATKLR